MTDQSDRVRVATVMDEVVSDARNRIRRRLLERGVTDYEDAALFDRVRTILQRAVDRAAGPGAPFPAGSAGSLDGLLLPGLLADDGEWTLEPNLQLSSHRARFGRAVLIVKRRLVMPLTRWLFEYSQSNFRRQQRLNRLLLACIEEIAIENARLRRELDALSRK